MKRILAFVLAALAVPVFAEEVQIKIDPAATKINWSLDSVLHKVHGTFKLKGGTLSFDPATGKAGGQLVVDATSGESGNGSRDGRMHKSIIESPKFPEIAFVPDRVDGPVNLNGDSDVVLHGAFTLHGGSHELSMKVHSHFEQQKLTAKIAFKVPYISWGLKNPSTLFLRVEDTVDVQMEAQGDVVGAAH
jgi:polyisoprenoid-binding protein YceI